MSGGNNQGDAFKQPMVAWKALLTILAAFSSLIILAFVDIFALEQQERSFGEARALVQDILEMRQLANSGNAEPQELKTIGADITKRLDDDMFRFKDGNHLRAAPQSEEWLILATGRILAGAMRWEAVRRRLNFVRYGIGIAAAVAFVVTIISIVITTWGKDDPLEEIAAKVPVILSWSVRGIVSVPACVVLAFLFVILVFLFGDLHLTSEVLREDINRSYLFHDLVNHGNDLP